jgi:hypothetical protein
MTLIAAAALVAKSAWKIHAIAEWNGSGVQPKAARCSGANIRVIKWLSIERNSVAAIILILMGIMKAMVKC